MTVNEYGSLRLTYPTQLPKIGGKAYDGPRGPCYHVYFTAGVHPRERGGPDNLIYFIADLLFARKHSTGLKYDAKSYSNADVHKALQTGIVFFPLVNPDGVWYDQKTDSLWRKNRNPADATAGIDATRVWIAIAITIFSGISEALPRAARTRRPRVDKPDPQTYHGRYALSSGDAQRAGVRSVPRIRW